jgi:DNA polymerase-3 subunit chi
MQVDFYQLSRDPVEHVLPSIAQRVLDSGQRLLVVAAERERLDAIGEGLWTAEPPVSFLANGHADGEHPDRQPILLATGTFADSPAANGARYIALADGEWREAALDFDRVFYFFDAMTIDGARSSWRALSGRDGVEPRFWRQDGRKWVRDA